MDWKKWFSFQNEEEDHSIESNEQTYKDLETRITYQYPKSHLQSNKQDGRMERLKADLPVTRRKRRLENNEETRVERKNRTPIRRTTQDEKSIHNLDRELEKMTDTNKIEKKVVKRPFRPTEIPPPMYGLLKKQIKRTKEVVEIELTGLPEEDQKQIEDSSKDSKETADVNDRDSTTNSTTEQFSTNLLNINEEKNSDPFTEKEEESLKATDDFNEGGLDEGSDGIKDLGTDEGSEIVESTVPKEKELSLLVNLAEIDQKEQMEDSFDEGQREEMIESSSSSLDTNQDGQKEEDLLTKKFVQEETSKIEESRPKRRIPINVMMLKSDRELLERKRNEQIKPSVPTKELDEKDTLNQDDETAQDSTLYQLEARDNNVTMNQHEAVQNGVVAEASDQMDPVNNIETTQLIEDQDSESYHLPDKDLLNPPVSQVSNSTWLNEQADILDQTLKSFNVGAKVVSVSEGPSVTRFEIAPELGVKVNKITNLVDDLKLSLAAKDIRIEAPIPGKHTVGIEVPNETVRPVRLREILDHETFVDAKSPLTVAMGLDITGKPIITDLKKMPHGLIAGATGSGKSVCINTFIISLLYKAKPDEVKLLLIDPKMVELAPYNHIPHLISPVITNVKAATAALKWAVEEMERRYELFAATGVRDISKFNEKDESGEHKLPFIVIIIDELADLMMMAPADVEEAIARIAQKARACGIHLLIATQRPSVDVITGLIKANVPTRIAFSVSSQVDSRTIIDISGAERLLGRGDMLFLDNGTSKPVRLQGPFISDEEIDLVVNHVASQGEPEYLFEQEELMKKAEIDEHDELLLEACEFAVMQGNISTSSLQRHFRIGYNRAARLIELMESQGMITESKGSKPRDVLITEQDLNQLI